MLNDIFIAMINETFQVTVVMAVYNAEKTLPRAIDSVINQTYCNWLLICVNDGSTDNSLDVLYQYAEKDTRIRVLTQENEGPAAARAKAYEVVETPYVIMLDADDFYSLDLLECLVTKANQSGADAIVPNVKIEQIDGRFMDWNQSYHFTLGMEMDGREAFSRTFIEPSMHGINLWKTDLVKRFSNKENTEYNKMNADEFIQRLLFLNSKKIVFSGGTYFYTYNQSSITKKFSLRQVGYLETCRKYIDLIAAYNLDDEIASVIKEYYFRHIIHLKIRLYKDGTDLTPDDRKMMGLKIKEAYNDAIKYKTNFVFREKRFAFLYKKASASNYFMFCLTCFLFAQYLIYKSKCHI